MSSESYFEDEDGDIIRLTAGANEQPGRRGWVNCGPHSICIEMDDEGSLTVECYARGREGEEPLRRVAVDSNTVLAAGGRDFDEDDESKDD